MSSRSVRATQAGIEILKAARSRTRRELDGKVWTFLDIATEAGMSEKTVSRFFKGGDVDDAYARSICRSLQISFEAVIEMTVELEPSADQTEPDKSGQMREPSMDGSPFIWGRAVPPDRFYGRVQEMREVSSRLGKQQPESVNLVGLWRSGKTSLLQLMQARPEVFCGADALMQGYPPLMVMLPLQDARYQTPEGMVEGIRRGIEHHQGRSPWAKEANQDPYEVADGLEALRDRGVRLIVMLDELEAIEHRLEQFQGWGEDWRSKASAGMFALVIASRRPLEEVYAQVGLTSPFANIFSRTVLGPLAVADWQRLVREGWPQVGTAELDWVDDLAGGMPFYVQMAAGLLWLYEGDFDKARREFAFQAESRFRELDRGLTAAEQQAIRTGKGLSSAMIDRLERYGVLREDGRLFSSAFTVWLRQN